MTRLRALALLSAWLAAPAGASAAPAASSDAPGAALDDLKAPLAAPFSITIRDRSWDGNTHARPSGRAVLAADGQAIWELSNVTEATASADGSTVALLTTAYEVYVSRLPEPPRRIDGGLYLSPALSADGTFLVAHALGEGGHILEKTRNTRGIELIDVSIGEQRLVLEGNDLYAPSFASERMVFFGSGGKEQMASLYLLDLRSMAVARVTNREPGAGQTFPSEAPQLADGTVVYRADDQLVRVAAPAAEDFVPVHRFDPPTLEAAEGVSPDFGTVLIRRPSTQTDHDPKIYQYFDLDRRLLLKRDWFCLTRTYDQHLGTDFNQPYGRDVVAPATGLVFWRYDGCADTNSPGCGFGFGNFAALVHADGSVSLEAHGRAWTVAEQGARLKCADKLMESASSGNSNVYHIHHESWVDQTGNVNLKLRYDPYRGGCDVDDPSKWSTQNEYRDLPGDTCEN